MASAESFTRRPGVIIDLLEELTVNITQTKTFQGDTTYLVSGQITCSAAVTIEGGAVFKYPSSPTAFIKLNNTLTCKTSSYRPAIFTAIDDDTVGDMAPGSSHTVSGFYANPALHVYYLYGPSLSNLRFSHCQEAVRFEEDFNTTGVTVSHSQFVDCVKGIVLTGGAGSSTATPLTAKNCLMVGVQYPLTANVGTMGCLLSHCTIDNATQLITGNTTSSFIFTNSVFANVPVLKTSPSVTLSGNFNGFYPQSNPQFGNNKFWSDSNPFQTGDSGNHYLTDASGFRARGTAAIDSTLLTALKTRTTYPPISFPRFTEVTGELTLFPQVPRYVSGTPDLGYYYDVLDYTVAAMFVEGGTVMVQPGTVIGLRQESAPEEWWPWWWTEVGIEVLKDSTFISRGTPNRPNIFADVQLVQEAAELPTGSLFSTDQLTDFAPDDPNKTAPILDFRFSNFYVSSDLYQLSTGDSFTWSSAINMNLRDCNLYGGWFWIGKEQFGVNPTCSLAWINNLFDRVKCNVDPDWLDEGDPTLYVDLGFEARNNLFRRGGLLLAPIPATAGSWVFKDNLFDKEEFLQDTSQPLDHDYNAYYQLVSSPISEFRWGGTARLANSDGTFGANDRELTAAPGYLPTTFGEYYLATTSPLYNTSQRGSRSPSDAGLYHFTTRIDQTKDGAQSGNIIIGRHYVAAASGLPKDSDGDGIPDYVEDANGNGIVDAEETNPALAQTEAGVPDSTNTKYDDVDLDGDGMVGRLEKALPRNPLVADNPLAPTQPVNGPLPNTLTFTLPSLNFDQLTAVGRLIVVANGTAVSSFRTDRQMNGSCLVTWDMTFEGSGPRYLQVGIILNGQVVPSGIGPIAAADVMVTAPPFTYPLVPGSPDWINADPYDRVDSTIIPQAWQDTASSWQLFCSVVANPYFRTIWHIGDKMTDSYAAARSSPTLSILAVVDSSADFGQNCSRFLRAVDPPALVADFYDVGGISIFDYINACTMAGSDASLNTLNQSQLQQLFALTAWDANKLASTADYIPASAPLRVMYSAYARLSPPPGVTLDPLTAEQAEQLDSGYFPEDLLSVPGSVVSDLGLNARP